MHTPTVIFEGSHRYHVMVGEPQVLLTLFDTGDTDDTDDAISWSFDSAYMDRFDAVNRAEMLLTDWPHVRIVDMEPTDNVLPFRISRRSRQSKDVS